MAQVVVEMSGDEAKLYKAYQRIIDQSKKLDGSLKENKKASSDAFGDGAISQLASYASRVAGVAGAFAAAAAAIRAMREESDRLGQGQRTSGPAFGQLAQLADTPAQLARLTQQAKMTFAEGGARSLEQAAALQFSLESAGAGSFRADFSRAQATGLIPNAQTMAESASMLQKAFGASKTGSFRDIAGMAFGAAATGLGSVEEIQAAGAMAGSQASRIGLSPEETLAAIATISGTLGPSEAGAAFRALSKSIEVEAIGGGHTKKGQDLAGYLRDIQAKEKGGAKIFDMLGGRIEAVTAYGLLTNESGAAQYPSILQDTVTGRQTDAMGRKLGLAMTIPENRAAAAAQMAENRAGLGGTNQGTIENLADALAADMQQQYRERYGSFGAAASPPTIAMDRWFGNEDFLSRRKKWGSPETQAAITDLLAEIARSKGSTGGLPSEDLERFKAALDAASSSLENNSGRAKAAHHMMPE
jgi:hypothetical protein